MQSSAPGPSTSGGVHPHQASVDDADSDLDDPVVQGSRERDVLSSDPLDGRSSNDPQAASRFPFQNFFSQAFSGAAQRPPSPPASPPREYTLRRRTPTYGANVGESDLSPSEFNSHPNGFGYTQEAKHVGGNIDWYIEGPGRRVGYDDLTAIDWIFEYAKERQRLRVLASTGSGLVGHFRRFIDASHIWWILVASGIATGLVAASISVVSGWLGDVKRGICTSGPGGGKFYLSRSFCCWELDDQSRCKDWRFWSDFFGISSSSGSYTVEYIFFVLFSVLFAVIASILVVCFSTYAKQSGIPEVKTVLGGFVIKKFMSTWTLTVKSVGLCLSVASGLWLGKEGPLVHVACCCANVFIKMVPSLKENEARKREVLSAAAASGISVAFGAPVGGVLFSLEQLSFYFPDKTMWQSFVCAMVAAVTLHAVNPFRTGKLVLYQVTYDTQWHAFELVPFAILGILGGVYGGLFIKLNMRIAKWRKGRDYLKNPVIEVALFALITALINFPNKFMRAQPTELVATLFSECSELKNEQLGLCGRAPISILITNLMAAAVLGFILTSATFGLHIPSGIILPSMAVGALLGRAMGSLIRNWHEAYPGALIFARCNPEGPCITAGTYAIVGAAAALSGATRMTVSIVVIMFELTGALIYVLPIMITVLLSKWVGDAFGTKGIYESWINFNGYPFLDNRDDSPVPDVPASNIMTRIDDLVVIPATGHTIQSLDSLLKHHPFRGFPVVSSPPNTTLLGYISRTELTYALQSALAPPHRLLASAEAYFSHQPLADPNTSLDLRPWMDQTPITLNAKSSLQVAADMFLRLGLRYLMFCERGELKGLLTKKDVWYVLNDAGERRNVATRGMLREDTQGERRGLLGIGDDDGDDDDDAIEDERDGRSRGR